MCVKLRFQVAQTKKPDRQPRWSPIGRFSLRSGEHFQLLSLLFSSRPFWTLPTTTCIVVPRWAIAISLRASTALTTTAALEAFEHLLEFVTIQCPVFVSVASIEHSLHPLGHLFAADFSVFVLVEAHDSIEELVSVAGTTAFTTTPTFTRSSTLSTATAFSVA